MNEEVWKDAVGYEEYFMISNTGRVFSKRTKRLLKHVQNKAGYLVFSTRLGGRNSQAILLRIHRLVAEAFIENPLNKPFVNHIDSCRTNNNSNNLEWVTAKENYDHADNKGRMVSFNRRSGFDSSGGKLSSEDMLFIINNSKYYNGNMSNRCIARLLGLSHTVIGALLRKESYKVEFEEIKKQP